jgi:hypothetical protein
MIYLGVAVAVVAVCAIGVLFLMKCVETEGNAQRLWLLGGCVYLVLVFAGTLAVADRANREGPCLRYETREILVGKVMTPYRVCVERGEWITDGDR